MKGKRYTEEQIIRFLEERVEGIPAQDVFCKYRVVDRTFSGENVLDDIFGKSSEADAAPRFCWVPVVGLLGEPMLSLAAR